MKQLHAVVSGKVQGVFFRAHTQEKAIALGLRGWVRNNSDGSVETIAEGSEENLKTFLVWLKNEGSPASAIEKVKEKWGEARGKFTGFTIQH